MWSAAYLRGASPLVSFNHVIDPHFVAFSSSLYTTICNPKSNPNPNPNPTVITDPQIGRKDLQIVTVQIRPADPSRSTFCRVPFSSQYQNVSILDVIGAKDDGSGGNNWS